MNEKKNKVMASSTEKTEINSSNQVHFTGEGRTKYL